MKDVLFVRPPLRGRGWRRDDLDERVRGPVGAEESNKREGEWDAENLAELMPNPPEVTAGEVVAHG